MQNRWTFLSHTLPLPPPPQQQQHIQSPAEAISRTFHLTAPLPSSLFITRYTNRRRPPLYANAETKKFNSDLGRAENVGDDEVEFNSSMRQGRSRRRRRRRGRQWWSDEADEEGGDEVWWIMFLEELVDSLWILKVFKSYGWTLPLIVFSWTLATGPKAFLMALALPIGQGLLTFSFNKLWGLTRGNRKPRPKARRYRSSVYTKDFTSEDEEEVKGERWATRNQRKQDESAVAGEDDDDDVVDKRTGRTTFGGWDELVGEPEVKAFSAPRIDRREATTENGNVAPRIDRREATTENGNVNGRVKGRDLPLLLRLLIAVFPFLGFWIGLL